MIASGGGVPLGLVAVTTAARPEIACASGFGAMVKGRSRVLPSDWSMRWRT
jgi:hypothetical protein